MRNNLILDINLDAGNESGEITEPVTVADAKKHMYIDSSENDSLIEELITTARQQIEHYLCISLIPRTVSAYLQIQLPGCDPEYELPYGPVHDIQLVTDDAREPNEITSDRYKVHGTGFKTISCLFTDRVHVTYTAGYDTLPKVFKTGILQQVAYMYVNRGDEEKMAQLSPMVSVNLKPYRRVV